MAIRKLAPCVDKLHEDAIRQTGFDDFGDPTYRQGLRVLLEAFDTDLRLTETGWQVAFDMILRILIARLYTQRGWLEHPEVFANPIHRPLVIIGLPRTGTTALHRLLSVDPQFQGLETWLAQTPMIRPPRETWELYPEYRACVANLQALCAGQPDFYKAHDFAADELEECGGILDQSFSHKPWATFLPTYDRWLLSQNVRKSYHRYVSVLRLIGAREPHKRWLLKGPYHMFHINTLLEVFPDALVIHTHRDPLKAIPSFCSLLHMVVRNFEGDAAKADALGPGQCAFWREALDYMQAARQKSPMQFFDVDHRRFLVDPLEVVHSIYDHFNLSLWPDAEQKMHVWTAASPTSRHGKHEYSYDSWGVTPLQIRDNFLEYRAQYGFNRAANYSA